MKQSNGTGNMANLPESNIDGVAQSLARPGLRPADKTTLFFILFQTLMIGLQYRFIPHANLFLAVHAVIALYILALRRFPVRGSHPLLTFLRLWYPVVVIPVLFTELREIVPAVTFQDLDLHLIHLDRLFFGGQPSIMLQHLQFPALTDMLQLVYSLFYFLPLFLGVYLVFCRKLEVYDFYYFLISYGFFLSYLGYFLVPAIGPRFLLRHLYSAPLEGLWLYHPLNNLLNHVESINRDCFPSGHTMMTLVVIHFAWSHARKLFYIYLPVGILLIFATLYLRYHYGIDLLAAVVFYLFAWFSSRPLYRLLLRWAPGARLAARLSPSPSNAE